jgi:hypothetical protein
MRSLIISTSAQYCTGDKIEKNDMGEACSADGEERGVYRVLVGKPEGKRQLGIPRHRWENNINLDPQEVGSAVWTGLGWLRIEIGREQLCMR